MGDVVGAALYSCKMQIYHGASAGHGLCPRSSYVWRYNCLPGAPLMLVVLLWEGAVKYYNCHALC